MVHEEHKAAMSAKDFGVWTLCVEWCNTDDGEASPTEKPPHEVSLSPPTVSRDRAGSATADGVTLFPS
jgi:hypothetical protein